MFAFDVSVPVDVMKVNSEDLLIRTTRVECQGERKNRSLIMDLEAYRDNLRMV